MNNHSDDALSRPTRRLRRWRTVRQIAQRLDGTFTEAAIRGQINRAEPHYDCRGELVPGNGLAPYIARPTGKGGRVLIDDDGYDVWLGGGRLDQQAEQFAARDNGTDAGMRAANPNIGHGRQRKAGEQRAT